MILENKTNKTSFDYTWSEYFSILVEQLNVSRNVLSTISIENQDILPHMKIHLERLIWEKKWNEIIKKIDEISEMKNLPDIIKTQLDIFKNTIIKKLT